MKVIGNIIKLILSIILTCCIILCIGANIASSTVLSKEFVLRKLEETNYYANISTSVKNDFENYIYQSGLEENVLNNIVTPEKIENDTKTIINNIYDGTNETVDTTEIENNLRNNIQASIDGNLTATQEKMVDEFVNKITQQYKDTITNTNYENSIYNILNNVNTMTQWAKQISLVAIIILTIIILIIPFREILSGFLFIFASLISSGAFYIIANIVINTKVKIQNITILNDAISLVLRDVITSVLTKLTTIGWGLALVGLVVLIIFAIIRSYKKEVTEVD